jgi:hypothetical protein
MSDAFKGASCVTKASQNVVNIINNKRNCPILDSGNVFVFLTTLKCLRARPMRRGNMTVCPNTTTEFNTDTTAEDPS